MLYQTDYLLRQIESFAAGLASRLIGSKADTEVTLSADDMAAASGLSLDTMERVPSAMALQLLTGPEGFEAPRAMAMAMCLASRSMDALAAGDAQRAELLAARVRSLAQAALTERPDLASPGVQRVLELMA